MTDRVAIPIRGLVEYVYRGGSIEPGFSTGQPLEDGAKAHRAIQMTYIEPDRHEVPLEGEVEAGGLTLQLEGRCDGLRFDETGVTIEEIKSTAGDIAAIGEDGYPVHWAQAKCYAYLYAKREGIERLRVRLVYVNTVSGEQRQFQRTAELVELETFVQALAEAYAPFARMQAEHTRRRDESIRALPFPFAAYRANQRRFAGTVYKAVVDRKRLFARAPTGTGKTISTLFPAVKAIGEGELTRIFYLTAKTTTRAAAEDAMARMEAHGLRLRAATITAKEKICFQEEVRCQKEHCAYADGHYDRINEAMLDLLTHETLLTRSVFEAYARKYRVCPFEFSLDAAYAADAIICDYNYWFDPRISLKRLMEEQKRQTALLVDEAHNLPDRAREMYSAELDKAPFLQLKRDLKEAAPGVARVAKAVNDYFIALRKAVEAEGDRHAVYREKPDALLPLLETFLAEAEKLLVAGSRSPAQQPDELLVDTYYAAQQVMRTAELYDERYVTYVVVSGGDVRLKFYCLDPSAQLKRMTKGVRSQVYFSATLLPLSYYREMLGGEEDDYTVSIPSPFRKEQLSVFVSSLSTRFRNRERTKAAMAARLHAFVRERRGNVLIFFPSYEYLRTVYELFAQEAAPGPVLVQEQAMSEEERESFLGAFQPGLPEPITGFAVLGGAFSEGVDLTGERLTGVAVVGVGLPQLGLERDLIRDFYDRSGRSGFDFAYVLPGMNKVLQAGGRLIRTEQDEGALLLIDDRFIEPGFERLLPEEWKPVRVLRE